MNLYSGFAWKGIELCYTMARRECMKFRFRTKYLTNNGGKVWRTNERRFKITVGPHSRHFKQRHLLPGSKFSCKSLNDPKRHFHSYSSAEAYRNKLSHGPVSTISDRPRKVVNGMDWRDNEFGRKTKTARQRDGLELIKSWVQCRVKKNWFKWNCLQAQDLFSFITPLRASAPMQGHRQLATKCSFWWFL